MLVNVEACQLVDIFDHLFTISHNTRLISGGEEPIYLPYSATVSYHRIVFTRDYFASALHEIAHWCIAGAERREQKDYGYWYAPDGRNQTQQALFEQVEVKPQALEWIFASASNYPFQVSADNLQADLQASETFKQNIHQQVLTYCRVGLPPRAAQFAAALAVYYKTDNYLSVNRYTRSV